MNLARFYSEETVYDLRLEFAVRKCLV
jgi:hypothetical protein